MKYLTATRAILVMILGMVTITGCTLSTTGLRPAKDHSQAWGAITEVYDKPKVVEVATPEQERACRPPSLTGSTADLSGCKAGDKIVIRGLNFGLDDADLNEPDKQLLDQVVLALKAAPDIAVDIAGHTDTQGEASYNQGLSERRAQAVKQYLADKGIRADRMQAKGYGESSPVADNKSAEGRYLNRRVELVVAGAASAGAVPAAASMTHAPVAEAPPDPLSDASTVSIVDNAFDPDELTVQAGSTVTWTNDGGSNHIVQFEDSASPRLRSGAQYSKTFEEPGVYSYECKIHGSRMSGKVIVAN